MIASPPPLPAPVAIARLAPIGRQALPAHGCAAYLWQADGSAGTAGPIAMAVAEAATLRLSLDGAPAIDLPRIAQRGEATLGLTTVAEYRTGGVSATLTLTIAPRADLRDGAAVPQGTLRVARDGGDELVVPLAGLVGCAQGR